MRYVIYGAGAIGGTIGARLAQNGREVALIARGPHLEAIRDDGLTLRTPDETLTQKITVAGHPDEIDWRADDVAVLAMKTQDTADALTALRGAAGDVPVVCAQNGVANERMAARLFSRVYGMVVWLPGTHLQPGEVIAHSSPIAGILHGGRYQQGTDHLIEAVAADLRASGFASQPNEKIMRLKYAKLLSNLLNIVQALSSGAAGDIVRAVREEANAVYAAAGIDFAGPEELQGHVKGITVKPVPAFEEGHNAELIDSRLGGSTWQSLSRGGSLETDYLNGEIALLGALHNVPTPYNRMLQAAAAEASREGREPGSYTPEELLARLPA
ncbi:MAG: ketopantoate reductase family protein [Chloroflexi bacterium]|nr:ketopantoate reductase family protein [Chloroflexota bacterium]